VQLRGRPVSPRNPTIFGLATMVGIHFAMRTLHFSVVGAPLLARREAEIQLHILANAGLSYIESCYSGRSSGSDETLRNVVSRRSEVEQ
jgi:hypothetical protein